MFRASPTGYPFTRKFILSHDLLSPHEILRSWPSCFLVINYNKRRVRSRIRRETQSSFGVACFSSFGGWVPFETLGSHAAQSLGLASAVAKVPPAPLTPPPPRSPDRRRPSPRLATPLASDPGVVEGRGATHDDRQRGPSTLRSRADAPPLTESWAPVGTDASDADGAAPG